MTFQRATAFKIARLGLGYVPQGRHIFGSLNVVENLSMASSILAITAL